METVGLFLLVVLIADLVWIRWIETHKLNGPECGPDRPLFGRNKPAERF